MIRPVSDAVSHQTPEDWRILRALSFYRLLLVTLQLLLLESGYLARIFDLFRETWFYGTCVAYAIAALLLYIPIEKRRPSLSLQANGHFAIDVLAIVSIAYACGGVPSGLGMLVMTPAVGCSMVTSTRMAWVQASFATLVIFIEETLRQYPIGFDAPTYAQAGILGLMFFATSLAANAVAVRARRSEALAAQTGIDLANLARLNERVIEQMQTGVLVAEAGGRIRLMNAAAARLLRTRTGASLALEAPGLALALAEWQSSGTGGGAPIAPRPGSDEVIPRFTRLEGGDQAPVLVLVDDALSVREQAQQLKLAALGRLSASIAHEIRNPLSAISQAGQLLAESPGIDAENQKLLGMIQRHSTRIDKIIKDVMALSRREAPAPGAIVLHDWLRQAVAQYHEGHPRDARPIHIEAPEGLQVRFDPHHLQQVLYNLWDNSFLHGRSARPDLQVTVEGRPGEADVGPVLDVSDDGPGIPVDEQHRMFEPFFTTGHGGTGLGLFLARELCEYNHARLSYRPQAKGACFRLVFSHAVDAPT